MQTWCSDTAYSTSAFNEAPPVNKAVFKAETGELLLLRLAGTEIDTFGGTAVTKAQGVLLIDVPVAGTYTDRSIMAEATGPAGHLRFKVNLRIRTF
ncbi:hypothetical protein D1871_04065 [Nakamurella silvestris]|nr:hypothetical protein D1871_04065 [Nakamurella silvestris]